jgi:hypothetical protein
MVVSGASNKGSAKCVVAIGTSNPDQRPDGHCAGEVEHRRKLQTASVFRPRVQWVYFIARLSP